MNRMKDLFWMAVIVLFAAFSSCSDDKNDGTDEGVEAKLLTFMLKIIQVYYQMII